MPQVTSRIARTDAELARRLGFSRVTIGDWRARFVDTPATRDVEAWRAFVARHDLGRSPNRAGVDPDVRRAAQEAMLAAEGALYRCERIVARADPARGLAFLAGRRKVAATLAPLWAIVERV